MLVITSSFSINDGYLVHPKLEAPIELFVPKKGEYSPSCQYKISKDKNGQIKAYSRELPILADSCDFISAQIVGMPFEFDMRFREDGSKIVKTSIGLYNKFYVKAAFFKQQADYIWNLVEHKGEKPVLQIMIDGRLSNRVHENKRYWDILVSQFSILTWNPQNVKPEQKSPLDNVVPIQDDVLF